MTVLVWDWNGTLYDDVHLGFSCINRLLKKYKLKPLESLETYKEVFDFPVIDYYRKVGFDFDKLDWDTIANEFMDDYVSQTDTLKLARDAEEALQLSAEHGFKNVILSASEINNLKAQVAPFHLDRWISEIHGIENIYAHSKEELAKQLVQSFPEDETIIFIGDTLHDAQVAKAAGARTILTDQGHQSYSRLIKAGVPVVHTLKEAVEKVVAERQ